MGKIVSGVVSSLLAGVVFLYGLSCPASNNDPWLFAKIPALWFFGVEIPRVFVLGIAVVWFVGGVGVALGAVAEMADVGAFAAKLKAGTSPADVLAADVEATTFVNDLCERAARHLLRGARYEAAVRDIEAKTKTPRDEVVLWYRAAAEHLAGRAALVRRACEKIAVPCPLPDFAFPAVLIAESQPRKVGDYFTKVDLSTTGNQTPLLTAGDLLFDYDGHLVWNADQLAGLTAGLGASGRVPVAVLRRVKLTSNHPVMGVEDEYGWVALRFEIAAGPLAVKHETHGAEPADPPAPAVPEDVRFVCPCGKRMKAPRAAVGKSLRCPNCASPLRVPAAATS